MQQSGGQYQNTQAGESTSPHPTDRPTARWAKGTLTALHVWI